MLVGCGGYSHNHCIITEIGGDILNKINSHEKIKITNLNTFMKINQKYEKLVLLMEKYDNSSVDSCERKDIGGQIDKLASKLSSRDCEQLVSEYRKYVSSK